MFAPLRSIVFVGNGKGFFRPAERRKFSADRARFFACAVDRVLRFLQLFARFFEQVGKFFEVGMKFGKHSSKFARTLFDRGGTESVLAVACSASGHRYSIAL